VAGPKETLRYLRFYAHPYVYSCALPPVVVAAILKALEIGTREPELRTKLWENADYFHGQLRNVGIDTGGSTTYIMPLVIGDRERMYRLGHELRRRGLWVAPVDYPAVPQNKICFRASPDDAGGRKLARRDLWRGRWTPLLLSQSKHQRCGNGAPCLREYAR